MSPGWADKVVLGRTGLEVSRIGIGSSYGVPYRACMEAFERGVNYFFWGSVRTRGMGAALREIAGRDREQLVFVLECYARRPSWIARSVEAGLRKARIDQADILLLGWHDKMPAERTLEAALALRDAGRVRYLAISGHDRQLLRKLIDQGHYDIVHLRYNAAHPGAETDIFPYLPANARPGIVSFTNTRWGDLLKAKNMPPGMAPPSAADCYRFSLSNPNVDVAISGPKNAAEMAEALSVLDGAAMDEDELARMRTIGDHVHGLRTLASIIS
jgi:aryl-alcohol dehydrogenase-like predicted oxidoreductase